ncbi:peptidyl-prolyl cis-trans isomerase FKBP53 isoform X2 [Mangifera indica]|uniref:peptidyl-prolyl cis-trans isomerase FKBP53 isoform X2 n=1 Tax=Mangifera indica TaxID=29780 RepID=UPI001CFB0C34|nr:peptidyl-prolyl cis-trans isomerase FKBP53 isoform X2 [Mangifera indica]
MGFWGIEVKPGKPHPYHSDNVQGTLHVTQATLGLGSSTEKAILQCSVGDKNPIFLCSLLPNQNESCSLNLEFNEDDLVTFSVIGPRSIHLSGYFVADDGDHLRDEYDSDSYGEDIIETDTDESSEFDTGDEYEDDIDDDDDLFPPSPVRNSGVVIEEIVDDEKPTNGNDRSKRLKKKDQSSNSEQQIVVKNSTGISVLESEDEDGFPINSSGKSKGTSQDSQVEVVDEMGKKSSEKSEKKKAKDSSDEGTGKKRKVKSVDHDDQTEKKKKKKKEKREQRQIKKAVISSEAEVLSEGENQQEVKSLNMNQKDLDNEAFNLPDEDHSKKKKKKQKKKKKAQESDGDGKTGQTVSTVQEQAAAKPSQVRSFPNGLVIEEVAMGKPDGKRASNGKQVSVHYIGKLKNGKMFDSNVGRAPFKFRLGIGQVIKGWDVGVNGMRVGDKRRLTIPPSMGYGAKGAGGKIPPNSWLVFDVELVDVQ